MIQRVVRNGRVRAFGAEWELSQHGLKHFREGGTARVKQDGTEGVTLWDWDRGRGRLLCICSATRRPVVDLMANLRESLSAKADQ